MKHVPVQHPSNEELFAYRDGELAGDKRLLIEAHVVSCASCRELVDGLSAIEADLKSRPQDVGDEYYARMTESVLAKIGARPGAKAAASAGTAGGAKTPEGARRPADDVPRIERRRPDQDLDAEEQRRRPVFPWFGVVGTGAATAAVLVVVVMLAQRQGEWVRAPRPVTTGEPEEPFSAVGDSAAERENEPPEGLVTGEKAKNEKLSRAKDAAREEDTSTLGKRADARLQETMANQARDEAPPALKEVAGEPETRSADEALGADKRMQAKPDEDAARLRSTAPEAQAPSAASLGSSAGPVGQPTAAYAAVIRAHGLPPVFDPARVDRDALLRAENDFRDLYMSGRAETDSARVRLYMAEAARAKADPADSAAVEGVIHHYWRTIRLSRKDAAVSAMAWRRLEEYQRETGRAP